MATSKIKFFKSLYRHLSEPIYLTDKTDEVKEEISHNCWAISAPSSLIAQITATELVEFIQNVKDNHQIQLNNSSLAIDLIFYMWLDEMAGQLRFNFINSNHDKLPFGCILQFTDSQEEIVNQFLKSKYHDGIPWEDLQTIDLSKENDEAANIKEENKEEFVLTVYKEIIFKNK